MKNDGKDSESIFQEKIASFGKKAYLYRIPDTRELTRGGKIKVLVRATPADFILTWRNGCGYAEVKSTSKGRFAISMMTPEQQATCRQQVAAGGKYWVFCHDIKTNLWYLFEGAWIVELMQREIKSLKLTDWMDFKW